MLSEGLEAAGEGGVAAAGPAPRLRDPGHRLLSVRAHLLEKAGDRVGAYDHYRRAARATASLAEPRYLESRANRIREPRPEQHQET